MSLVGVGEPSPTGEDVNMSETLLETPLQPTESDEIQPAADSAAAASAPPPPMSKNALKRLRKSQEWEAGKEDRRLRRREKRLGRKEKIRSQKAALVAKGLDPAELLPKKTQPSTLVPASIIIDCDFEKYMMDKERISLSSQVTRSYSDNRLARYRSHLYVAGWNGALRKRFHEVLRDQQKNWKGISFVDGDFLDCAEKARQRMKEDGGEMIESLQKSLDEKSEWVRDVKDPFPIPGPEPAFDEANRDVVYLSSDSPYTLERLEPNTSYVVGGLVDKNREKGLCYRRARERGIRTARLPIGQFMVMQSRQVLATNHVVEIMLKWLECGDWGQAFLSVIPKRKGGRLRGEEGAAADGEGSDGGDDDAKGEDEGEDEVENEEDGGDNEISDTLDGSIQQDSNVDDVEQTMTKES